MATISKIENKETKVTPLQNFQMDSVKSVNVKDIFFNMNPIIKNPIDLKRVSKRSESSLNLKSLAKALGVFLTTLGGYFLIKKTNVFSYFKGIDKEANLKNLHGNEITKVKNTVSSRKILETEKISNSFINYATSNYRSEDRIIKFKETKIEEFETLSKLKKENLKIRRFSSRRSINVQNPLPDQNITVREPFELIINGTSIFNSSSALSFEATNIPTWLISTSIINPTFKGSYDTPDWAQDVALSGNYAYVAAYKSGLQIIDISDPANPTFKGSYDMPDWAMGVAISGNYAYVASSNHNDYSSGLQIIDITDPANPTFKGSHNTLNSARKVTLSGNYAYVAGIDYDYMSGFLRIIDITYSTNPTFKGSYDTPRAAHGVAVSGNYAYVAAGDGDSGLQIIDITNPANPTFKGSYDTPGEAWGVAVSGNYAYVESGGLQIIDVSDPSNPTFKGSYDKNGALGVALSGNYAYVAGGSGLQIIDITDPANPTFKGAYNTPDTALEVTLSDNYTYVADRRSGLQIIDIDLNSDKLLLLSGTPSSVGIYGVDIKACNEEKECAINGFNIIVDDDRYAGYNDYYAIIEYLIFIIISSISIPVCIALIIGCGIVSIRQHYNKIFGDESNASTKELKEEKELQKMVSIRQHFNKIFGDESNASAKELKEEKELQKMELADDEKIVVDNELLRPLDEQKISQGVKRDEELVYYQN
jgi:hypothetical protein